MYNGFCTPIKIVRPRQWLCQKLELGDQDFSDWWKGHVVIERLSDDIFLVVISCLGEKSAWSTKIGKRTYINTMLGKATTNEAGLVVLLLPRKFLSFQPIFCNRDNFQVLKLDYVICHMVSRLTNLVMSWSQGWPGMQGIALYVSLGWQLYKYNISWLNSKAR